MHKVKAVSGRKSRTFPLREVSSVNDWVMIIPVYSPSLSSLINFAFLVHSSMASPRSCLQPDVTDTFLRDRRSWFKPLQAKEEPANGPYLFWPSAPSPTLVCKMQHQHPTNSPSCSSPVMKSTCLDLLKGQVQESQDAKWIYAENSWQLSGLTKMTASVGRHSSRT